MPRNLVRSHRQACGLSQHDLAQRAGTSHQRIQAIESYDQALYLELALRICAVLGQPVEAVFPSMAHAAPLLGRAVDPVSLSGTSVELAAQVKWAGLLPGHQRIETLRCRMRGGHTLDIRMDAAEGDRVWHALECTPGAGFMLIDSIDGCRYALNPQHLLVWKWVWDGRAEVSDAPRRGTLPTGVRIYLVDGGAPLDYDVAEDEPSLDDEHVGQLWDLFTFLQNSDDESRHTGRQEFADRDGELVFFHKADAAIVVAPLALIGSEEGMPWEFRRP